MNSTCNQMEELSSSIFLRCTLIFTLSSCAILIPMTIAASHSLWFSKSASLFHLNLRIILQLHLIGFLIHATGRFALHFIDLYNYFMLDPCTMIPNVWRCFWLRFIYAVGLWITSTTVVPLVMERWMATKYSNRYEHKGVAVGLVFVVVQCLVCSIHLVVLYSGSKIEGVVMPYCMVARDSKVNVGEINGFATVVVQLFARLIFQYLYKVNGKLRKKQLESTLSNRFQLEQNLMLDHHDFLVYFLFFRVMDILKVFANISTIYLSIHAFSFMAVLSLKEHVASPIYFSLVEINSSYPIYGIISILIMWNMLEKNRRKVNDNLQTHVNSTWQGDYQHFRVSELKTGK
uniref:Uncharacterized protein n=1 Tax=Caenorhabditis japonica TaxID=281687 RepID=A0A8R1HZJ5_CAEJA